MERKAKKMSWFDLWLWKRVQRARDMDEADQPTAILNGSIEDLELHNTIRFSISPARGGSVVTVARYDPRKDNNEKTVYVINENDDIGHRISEIVTMEMYRS